MACYKNASAFEVCAQWKSLVYTQVRSESAPNLGPPNLTSFSKHLCIHLEMFVPAANGLSEML